MKTELYYLVLNPDLSMMKEWVAALRSGTYKQTPGQLRRNEDSVYGEGFCCLGVVCDLYSQKGKGEWDGEAYSFQDIADLLALPQSITLSLFGSRHTSYIANAPLPVKTREEAFATLTDLNDSGLTFDQIADLIEYFYIKPYEGASDGQS